jgi:ADP-ribosylation factor protein 1
MSLATLPKDVVQLVALQLPVVDVVQLGLACRKLQHALLSAEAEQMWQRVAEREGGKGAEKRLATWRETVAAMCAMWSWRDLERPAKAGLGAKLLSLLSRAPPVVRVAVVGLPKTGKSTVVGRFRAGEAPPPEQLAVAQRARTPYRKSVYGLVEGEASTLRPRDWAALEAVVLVVDCNCREDLPAVASLVTVVAEKCKAPLLVLCNKQDLPTACSVAEMTEKLGLHALRSHSWYIQGACALSG